MNTFKRNTYRGAVAASGIMIFAFATVGLVAQVAAPGDEAGRSSAAVTIDNSFDQAEFRRHMSLIKSRADGFDVSERARFHRIGESASDAALSHTDGFDAAERARFERWAAGR